jgi:predicted nucleotidyltransferase
MLPMTVRDRLTCAMAPFEAVELAVLFGSIARDTDRRDSDIDLGVRLGDESAASRRALERALARAVPERRFDIVYLVDAAPQLRFEIARDGIVLVERVPYAWADFRARAMIDWWDWAPVARLIHRAVAERTRERRGPA